MKFFTILISIILMLCGLKYDNTAAQFGAESKGDNNSAVVIEEPETDDLGPAIWLNPDTGFYETSDGDSFAPESDDLGPAVWFNPNTGLYEASDGYTYSE